MRRLIVVTLTCLWLFAWAFLITLAVNACSAHAARQPEIFYYGIHCTTGKSALGFQSVTCGPRFGRGFTFVMSRQSVLLLHNGVPEWVRRNR